MSYIAIPSEWLEVGEPVKYSLMQRINDNLEDLNSRVDSISIAAGSNVLVNDLIEKPRDIHPVGSVLFASLSEAQFLSEMKDGEWKLADGSNVSGSDWATLTGKTTLPDIRGRFVRAKSHASGNNVDGDKNLDEYTADTTKAHTHDMSHGHGNSFGLTGSTTFASSTHKHIMSHDHQWGQLSGTTFSAWDSGGTLRTILQASTNSAIAGANNIPILDLTSRDYYTKPDSMINPAGGFTAGIIPLTESPTVTASVGFSGSVTNHSGNTGSSGSNETAPKYITENAFIKINKEYIEANTRLFVKRVAQTTNINQVLVTPVGQGTSGNFKINIKKGSTPALATQSIFVGTTVPTLAYNDTSAQSASTDPTQSEVAAGEYIVVSITEVQAKMEAVHIFVSGDY